MDKLIRQLSLLSFLLSSPRSYTAREVQESVEGYADMTDETFARRFHADRADLAKVGIEIGVLASSETTEAEASQLYYLRPDEFRMPAADFTDAEQRALCLALAALEGRFAYARPLRLALTALLRGSQDFMRDDLEHLPIAFAADEDAQSAGRQLSRLEDAVSRGKTVGFTYPDAECGQRDRTVDPYSLFLIQGHWYLVGHDHLREALRTFRVGRIKGSVRFPTERPRDFTVPADYDPERYRARPPWLIGPVIGTATISVGEDVSWWVKRLEPHVRWLQDADGYATFSVPYADEFPLLSWLAGLGGGSRILDPPELRQKAHEALLAVCRAHEGALDRDPPQERSFPKLRSGGQAGRSKVEPIAPEHLARTLSLLAYFLDEKSPELVTWQALHTDLGLSRKEVEEDLGLMNLINFGGGTYALTVEAVDEGVLVTRELMADVFSTPTRLSPVMAKALLLALDLVGDTLAVEGLESLASVRDKVHALVGHDDSRSDVIVDDLVRPDAAVMNVLNRAVRDHELVEIKYFTASRGELGERLIEPYLLFRSADGWYVEAYCHKACAQRTFKLERLCEARSTGRSFTPRPGVDLARRRTGEISPAAAEAQWATIAFRPRWRTYLEEKGTRHVSRADGAVEAHVPYLDELWLVQEVIRYLGEAVLEVPASVRLRINEAAATLASIYESEGDTSRPQGGKT